MYTFLFLKQICYFINFFFTSTSILKTCVRFHAVIFFFTHEWLDFMWWLVNRDCLFWLALFPSHVWFLTIMQLIYWITTKCWLARNSRKTLIPSWTFLQLSYLWLLFQITNIWKLLILLWVLLLYRVHSDSCTIFMFCISLMESCKKYSGILAKSDF